MFDFKKARRRDGEADSDRDDWIDETVEIQRLGYNNGDPLADRPYSEYPEQPSDLTTPNARQFVATLFEHPKVGSIRDAIEETTPATGGDMIVRDWRNAFERASELFGLEVTETEDTEDDRLDELVGDTFPEDTVDPSNPLVVGYLYAERGLSTDEVADVFGGCSGGQVRSVLEGVGLVSKADEHDGRPIDDILVDVPEGNVGTDIDTEAVANDDTIAVGTVDTE